MCLDAREAVISRRENSVEALFEAWESRFELLTQQTAVQSGHFNSVFWRKLPEELNS